MIISDRDILDYFLCPSISDRDHSLIINQITFPIEIHHVGGAERLTRLQRTRKENANRVSSSNVADVFVTDRG